MLSPDRMNKCKSLSVETLESRINLSTLTGVAGQVATASSVSNVAAYERSLPYRIQIRYDNGSDSVALTPVATPKGLSHIVTFTLEDDEATVPQVEQSLGATDLTQGNGPAVPLQGFGTGMIGTTGVSGISKPQISFQELLIDGSAGNDNITISQSGNTISVKVNSVTQNFVGSFGDICVMSDGGNDHITVNSSVTIATRIYGGKGNSVLNDGGKGTSTIVSIGGGKDILYGNGVNTMFWADQAGVDTVHTSAAEIAAGDVHLVNAFYQPWTNNPASVDYISKNLDGQNLRDPTDTGTVTNFSKTHSFWGTGPVETDVRQGQLSDCYFLGSLDSLAQENPAKLNNMAVDLGDGTYCVEFHRNGVASYVRVDGDLPYGTYYSGLKYAHPGATGSIWVPIFEKAYAFFRDGENSYASLNSGFAGEALNDLGIANTAFCTTASQALLAAQIKSTLAQHKPMVIGTNNAIVDSAPLAHWHTYAVTGESWQGANLMVTLHNPWGFDGFGHDNNTSDGYVTLSYQQFRDNCSYGVMGT